MEGAGKRETMGARYGRCTEERNNGSEVWKVHGREKQRDRGMEGARKRETMRARYGRCTEERNNESEVWKVHGREKQ